jgi:hypothetical protein
MGVMARRWRDAALSTSAQIWTVLMRRHRADLSSRCTEDWLESASYGPVVNRDEGLQRLSRAHALAIRLDGLGADHDLIAECLGVGTEAVGPLLVVARAKLERVATLPSHRLADIEGVS